MPGGNQPSPARRGTDRAIAWGFNGMWMIGLVLTIRLSTVGATVLAILAAVGTCLVFLAGVQMVLLLRRQWGRDGGPTSMREPPVDRPAVDVERDGGMRQGEPGGDGQTSRQR